jgi:predicted Zn-dependent protease
VADAERWAMSGKSRIRRLVGLAPHILSACPALAAQDDSVLETALRFFTRHDAVELVERIDSLRPAAVSPTDREAVLATLPPEGDVRDLDTAQRDKLAAARRILELHGRDTVYEVKVIDVPQAAVALHARAVVLVSEPALDLLDHEELQALVAHEVGHEYFWSGYVRARRDNDRSLRQTLELLCDGLAIVTLRRAGIDPKRLISALDKVVRYNRDRFGAALNEDDYPTIGERRRFARRLVAWLGPPGPPCLP